VNHLLPFFARMTLPEITVEQVDRYRAQKVRESDQRTRALRAWREQCAALEPGEDRPPAPPKPLAPVSINKTLTLLAQVLEQAVEYGHIDRNPATGKRRRLKVSNPEKPYLDQAVHIAALLDAAGELDRRAHAKRAHIPRRALLATLVFRGLRISELLDLRWRHATSPRGASASATPRPTPGIGRWTCSQRCATRSSSGRPRPRARPAPPACSPPRPAAG
jgi:integrase